MVQPRGKSKLWSRIFRAAVALLPLVGDKIQNVPLVWPPLGSVETYAAGVAAGVIALFGGLPALIKTKAIAKTGTRIGLGLSVISLFLYGYFLLSYVKGVETHGNGTLYRTIGGQRTDEALQKCHGMSDSEILEYAGLKDSDIERMWTPSSVKLARLELFLSYIACFASANFAIGAFTRASRDTNHPR